MQHRNELKSTPNLANVSRLSDKYVQITEPAAFEAACKSATHPKQILGILPTNQKELLQLPSETLVRAIQSISVLQSANKETIRTDFITSHPSFEQLCRCIRKCSTIFTPSELIRTLRSLIKLDVPTNSEISLVLLNLLRHEINYLSIDEIIQLDRILSGAQKSSELQNAVQKALPMVFSIQVRQQLDIGEPTPLLLRALTYLAYHYTAANDESVVRVCGILYGRRKELSGGDALSIVHSLCGINRLDLQNAIKLLAEGVRIVMERSDDMQLDELLELGRRVTKLAAKPEIRIIGHLHSFLQLCCDRIVQKDGGLESAVRMQSAFNRIVSSRLLENGAHLHALISIGVCCLFYLQNFQSKPLVQYIGEQLTADHCRTMDAATIFTVVHAFAGDCYVPEPVESRNLWTADMLPAILRNDHLSSIDAASSHWLHFTLHLLTLNHFDATLVGRVLSRAYLATFLKQSKAYSLDLSKVFIVYQTAAMNPSFAMDSADKDALEEHLRGYSTHTACPIQKPLIEALGADYIVANVRTRHSHWIQTLVKINTTTWTLEKVSTSLARDGHGFVQLEDITCMDNERL